MFIHVLIVHIMLTILFLIQHVHHHRYECTHSPMLARVSTFILIILVLKGNSYHPHSIHRSHHLCCSRLCSLSSFRMSPLIPILHVHAHHSRSALLPSPFSYCTFFLLIHFLHFYPRHFHISPPHPHSALLPSPFSYCTFFLLILVLHFYPHHFHTALSLSSSSFCTFILTIFVLHFLSPH